MRILSEADTGQNVDPVVQRAQAILFDIGVMLAEKNKAYGNSAADPVRVFSRAPADEQILVRIDDKLSRIVRGHAVAGEDTVRDLIGYLALLLAVRAEQK
jgi:hypothetical protein